MQKNVNYKKLLWKDRKDFKTYDEYRYFMDHWCLMINNYYTWIFNYLIDCFYKKYTKSWDKIIDVWCWSWDFYYKLNNELNIKCDYYWIDITNEQINNLKMRFPNVKWNTWNTYDFWKWKWKYNFINCCSVFQYVSNNDMKKSAKYFHSNLLDKWKIIIAVKNSKSLYGMTRNIIHFIFRKKDKDIYRSVNYYVKLFKDNGFQFLDINWYWIKPFFPFDFINNIFYTPESFLRLKFPNCNLLIRLLNSLSTQVYLCFEKK